MAAEPDRALRNLGRHLHHIVEHHRGLGIDRRAVPIEEDEFEHLGDAAVVVAERASRLGRLPRSGQCEKCCHDPIKRRTQPVHGITDFKFDNAPRMIETSVKR
ncbi:MAG TPA: hypothetical protein VFW19_07295 [Allosphingosinicella sp.]|nr:hypothetical protein [Allosphingosinicella sp.]